MAATWDRETSSLQFETTFLIPNLHCPTCVSHIESLMGDLGPRMIIKNISYIDHSLTVAHNVALRASIISDALSDSGYEIYDLILDPASNEQQPIKDKEASHFDTAIQRWNPLRPEVDEKVLAQHDIHCRVCAAQRTESKISDLESVSVEATLDFPVVHVAIVSVGGMTCSSCVGNVTRALHELSSVDHAEVTLVNHSATVYFKADDIDGEIGIIIEAIEDAGHDAELVEVRPERRQHHRRTEGPDDDWQVTYAIEGMSCGSCVVKITTSVQQLSFVKSVNINQIEGSGTVTFTEKGREAQILDAIKATGYTATQTEFKDLSENSTKRLTRTIQLSIQGMHCSHCPERVVTALRTLPLSVDKTPSMLNPVVTVSYKPEAPNFTIRDIIDALRVIDQSFFVTVYHPPSVEERSKRMLLKERRAILLRVLLCIAAAIPALILGVVYMNLVPHTSPDYMYLMQSLHGVSRLEWATFIIATPVYFFATDYFHRRTLKEVYAMWHSRSTVPVMKRFYRFGSMNMLISLGTTIAYLSSLAQLIIAATSPAKDLMEGSKQTYFDSVVFLTMFLLMGKLAEAHMKAKSGDAVSALGNLRPSKALLKETSHDSEISGFIDTDVDLLDVGDVIKIVHGASPPCDGHLLDERADFDESSLTGESRVIRKIAGEMIYSGTMNKGSVIIIQVSGPPGASLLDSIIQVVREGQAKRAPVERVADLLTSYFVPLVTAIAIVTWLLWLALGLSGALPSEYQDNAAGGWPFWSLQFAIAVFVIACPCGLGLAAPTALFVAGGIAARKGILVKGGGEAFQEASDLDALAFDKTGTLTEGVEPKIVQHSILGKSSSLDEEQLFAVLEAMEENSSHPLARAAVKFAAAHTKTKVNVSTANEIAGKGMKASFSVAEDSKSIKYEALVGNESLMHDYAIDIVPEIAQTLEPWKATGCSVIVLACRSYAEHDPWAIRAVLAAADPIRPEAASVVSSLQARNVDVWMLSGDNASTAAAVGSQIGIAANNIIADVLPTQKAERIKRLQQSLPSRRNGLFSTLSKQRRRATVAMVGDGINDAPALAAADVGIAVASSSDVAVQSAAFILIHSDLRAVLTLVKLSRAVFRRVILNFFWAAIYNIVALPVAAGVLYPITINGGSHVRLAPAWAALAMALSSISVVSSSLLLRTKISGVGFRE